MNREIAVSLESSLSHKRRRAAAGSRSRHDAGIRAGVHRLGFCKAARPRHALRCSYPRLPARAAEMHARRARVPSARGAASPALHRCDCAAGGDPERRAGAMQVRQLVVTVHCIWTCLVRRLQGTADAEVLSQPARSITIDVDSRGSTSSVASSGVRIHTRVQVGGVPLHDGNRSRARSGRKCPRCACVYTGCLETAFSDRPPVGLL